MGTRIASWPTFRQTTSVERRNTLRPSIPVSVVMSDPKHDTRRGSQAHRSIGSQGTPMSLCDYEPMSLSPDAKTRIDLTNKVALITGSSRGIGREIALRMGLAGARVAVNYNSSAAQAEEVVAEIGN